MNVYIWADDHAYSVAAKMRAVEAFKDLHGEESTKAIRGRGASGLLPEIHVLITVAALFAASKLAGGFLDAMGADAYRLLKDAIKKVRMVKPKKGRHFLEYILLYRKSPLSFESDIVLWIDFQDHSICIDMPPGDMDVDQALNDLPGFLDTCIVEGKKPTFVLWDTEKREWMSF